jgi:hypothetical protein
VEGFSQRKNLVGENFGGFSQNSPEKFDLGSFLALL